MPDFLSKYEQGLSSLLDKLGQEHARYAEALLLQSRLMENTTQVRQYGDTESLRAGRAQIVDVLNQLARETLGTSFNQLSGLPSDVPATPNVLQAHEQRYLEQVRQRYSTLYTEGVDQTPASLTDVFVMLEAVETSSHEMRVDILPTPEQIKEMEVKEPSAPENASRAPRGGVWFEPKPLVLPMSLSRVLQEHQHLLILGEPGSGKTTTLQFVALCFATGNWRQEKLGLTEDRIPVRVELRSYEGTGPLGESLVKTVADLGLFDATSAQTSQDIARSLLRNWLAEGRLAVLLDGLDEVVAAQRSTVAEAIACFARTKEGQHCRIVVTARTTGYRATRGLESFGCYTIRPFANRDDALPYATGWLKAIASVVAEEAEVRAQTLLEEMGQCGGLQRVIGNPLLLRLAVTFYVEHGQLAQSRGELYDCYVNEVIIARERRRGTENVRWSRQQVENALIAIAWVLQTEEPKTTTELVRILEQKIKGVDDGKALMDYMQERLGLLATYYHVRGERITFRHSTFREFFVAQRLAQSWETDEGQTWRFLRLRLHHADWREPILLLVTMIDEKDATELVERILKAKSPYERELHRDLLLAGECLGTGVRVSTELHRAVLDELLQLYLRELTIEALSQLTERNALQRLVVRPIEAIFAALVDDARADIMGSLLSTVRGKDERITLDKVAANVAYVMQTFVFLNRSVFREIVRARSLRAVREVIFFPVYIREDRARARTSRHRAAIKALGDLRLEARDEMVPVLLTALKDASTRAEAAETLSKIGPGTTEVMMALLDAQNQHRHEHGWDQTVERIIEALGLLGQRHAEAIEFMLDVVRSPEPDPHDVRYAVTRALCKSAETNCRAMAFVLEGWQSIHSGRTPFQSDNVKVLDEGIREGLRDSRKLLASASPDVIHYLLSIMRDCGETNLCSTAGGFLTHAAGDSPLIRCRMVKRDGSLGNRTLDLTDELFDIFLRRRTYRNFGDITLQLLVRWGLNRPEIIVRLINVIRDDAGALILADIIEGRINEIRQAMSEDGQRSERTRREMLRGLGMEVAPWVEMNEAKRIELEEAISYFKYSVARLRGPDKTVRDTELNGWLAAAHAAPEDSSQLKYLPLGIDSSKCGILHDAYGMVFGGLWLAHEWPLDEHFPKEINPYVAAALACFQGWIRTGSMTFSLDMTSADLHEEFQAGTDKALRILKNRGKTAVEVLASILSGEAAKLMNSALEKRLEEEAEEFGELGIEWNDIDDWRNRSKPDFRERSSAAYALAQLTGDHPEAQEVLLSNLKPHLGSPGDSFFAGREVPEYLIGPLGYVRHASIDLVSTLLDMATMRHRDLSGAGAIALGELQNPSLEAVPLLIQGYDVHAQPRTGFIEGYDTHAWLRVCLIKAAGTVKPATQEIVDLLLRALKDKDRRVQTAAATALGTVEEPDLMVVDSLLASIRHTPAAAEALGKLADRTTYADTNTQARLVRIAEMLQKTLSRDLPWSDLQVGRSGYDVVWEALDRVVSQLTAQAVADLPIDLPMLENGGTIVVLQAGQS